MRMYMLGTGVPGTAGSRAATLDAVLAYRHPGVLARYVKDFGGDRGDAEELFGELMRWLYLCARATEPGGSGRLSMYPEILRIDDMWHVFLMHTREYADFCDRYLGRFVHHYPTPTAEPRAQGEDAQLEGFLSFLYDELGEATVRRWFQEQRFAKAPTPAEPG